MVSRTTTITHYELNMSIKSTSKNHPLPPLVNLSILDLFSQLKKWDYENVNRTFGKESFCGLMPIIDIKNSQNRIDILLCLADKEGDTPETLDFSSRKRRTLKAEDGEGINTRGHIVIKIDPNTPTVARFSVENKLGITAKLFIDTLNYFLRDAKNTHPKFFIGNHATLRNPDGTPQPVKFAIRMNYSPLLSDEFIEAFEHGRIKDVQFEIPAKQTQAYDDIGVFVPQRKVEYVDVTLSIKKLAPNNGRLSINHIKQAFGGLIKSRPDLKDATFKIHYHDKAGKHHTVRYDPLTQEFVLVKKTYTKRHRINPENLELIPKLCDTMFAHLR